LPLFVELLELPSTGPSTTRRGEAKTGRSSCRRGEKSGHLPLRSEEAVGKTNHHHEYYLVDAQLKVGLGSLQKSLISLSSRFTGQSKGEEQKEKSAWTMHENHEKTAFLPPLDWFFSLSSRTFVPYELFL